MRGAKRPLLATAAVVVVLATALAFAWHPHTTGVPAARRIFADEGRFQTNTGAAQAMYDACRELLRSAQRCKANGEPELRCRPLYESAAIGQALTATLTHCRAPQIFAVHQTWVSFLQHLDGYRTKGGSAPELPGLTNC